METAVLSVYVIGAATVADAASKVEGTHPSFCPLIGFSLGRLEDVTSGQARINNGELQPRFIPMIVRKAKRLADLQKGDRIEMAVNDQNADE